MELRAQRRTQKEVGLENTLPKDEGSKADSKGGEGSKAHSKGGRVIKRTAQKLMLKQ